MTGFAFAAAMLVVSLSGQPPALTGQGASQSPVPEACRAADPQEQWGVDRQMADRQLDLTVRISGPLTGSTVHDVLTAINTSTGLRMKFDHTAPELTKPYTTALRDVSLNDALKTVLGANGLAFAVQGTRDVFVYSDTPENRQRFVESVQCFDLKNTTDVMSIMARLNHTAILQTTNGFRPVVIATRSRPRFIVRATPERMTEIQKFIEANDKR